MPAIERYSCTHYYWDELDRAYELEGIWTFYNNYPEMPDDWELNKLSVEDQERGSPDINVEPGSDVWRQIERSGISYERMMAYYD